MKKSYKKIYKSIFFPIIISALVFFLIFLQFGILTQNSKLKDKIKYLEFEQNRYRRSYDGEISEEDTIKIYNLSESIKGIEDWKSYAQETLDSYKYKILFIETEVNDIKNQIYSVEEVKEKQLDKINQRIDEINKEIIEVEKYLKGEKKDEGKGLLYWQARLRDLQYEIDLLNTEKMKHE